EPCLLVGTEVEDAELAVEQGRYRVAKHVVQLAQIAMPRLFAIEVVGINARRAETDINALTIRHRGAGAIWVVLLSGFVLGISHARLPKELAVRAIEAHERAPIFFLDRLSDEDAVSPHDGRRVARAGQRNAPADIFRVAPLAGEILVRRHTHSIPPAPARPIAGRGC